MTQMRVRSAGRVFAAQILGKLVAFPIGIVLARALGAAGKGTLSILQLVTQFAVMFLGLGMNGALLFLAGRRQVRGRDALLLSAAFGAGVTVIMYAVYVLTGPARVKDALSIPAGAPLLVAALLAGPAVIHNFMYQVVFGSGSVKTATNVVNISAVLQLAAYGGLFICGRLTLSTAIAVWALSVVGEATAVSIAGARVRPANGAARGARELFARGHRYGLAMWAAGLIGQAALRVDMFLLSAHKGPSAVGVYSVAVTFAELLWFVPTALGAVMVPKVSGEGAEALDVTLRLQRALLPVTLATACVVIGGAWLVVPVLYGPEFSSSIVPLVLLTPGAAAMAAAAMPSAYLSGIGRPSEWTKASAVNLVVNVIANLLLIPRFGASGAALASALSYSCAAIIVGRSFLRQTGSHIGEVWLLKKGDVEELVRAVKSTLAQKSSGVVEGR